MPFDCMPETKAVTPEFQKMLDWFGPNGPNGENWSGAEKPKKGTGCLATAWIAVDAERATNQIMFDEAESRGFRTYYQFNDAQTSYAPIREFLLACDRRLAALRSAALHTP